MSSLEELIAISNKTHSLAIAFEAYTGHLRSIYFTGDFIYEVMLLKEELRTANLLIENDKLKDITINEIANKLKVSPQSSKL